MSQELVAKNISELDFSRGFTEQQITLLKDNICKGATNDELMMFMYVCKRRKLDPFVKQIYCVKRWDGELNKYVYSHQTGIDGIRVVAQRTGKYRGQVGPYWCGKDGVWKDVWTADEYPVASKVGVIHADFSEPVWGVARWESYVQNKKDGTPTSMWKKMPESQLAKCAESLALRKAFPEDMSDLYIDEEMAGNDTDRANAKTNRIQETLKEPEAPKDIPTESIYVIDVGNFKGQTFQDVDPDELHKYVDKVKAKGINKPIPEDWMNFISKAESFLQNEAIAK